MIHKTKTVSNLWIVRDMHAWREAWPENSGQHILRHFLVRPYGTLVWPHVCVSTVRCVCVCDPCMVSPPIHSLSKNVSGSG